MRPATRIKIALRAARRRRYGWAALLQLRRGVVRALADLQSWRLNPDDTRRLDGSQEVRAIRAAYNRAVRELRRRWPALALTDPRSEP
jgi:hypothetical protein